jgi:adenine deaminase
MKNVLIHRKLFDEDFIQNWTIGFNQLVELVKKYTPEKVSKITWLIENDIIKTAKLYASKRPSSLDLGNGLDQHTNNFQSLRAIASSVAHDSHNIISVGLGDSDISGAINHLKEINGGLVVYHEGSIAELSLRARGR